VLFTAEVVKGFKAVIRLQGGFTMRYLGKKGRTADHHQLVAGPSDSDIEAVGIIQK
jgi:hypothetical protein